MNEAETDPTAVGPQTRGFLGRHKLALGLLAALLLAGAWWLMRRPAAPAPGRGGADGPVAVAVAAAVSGDMSVKIPALGTITPLATVTVKTQIAGQLQKIAFTEGQMVKAADFLAQIDPRPYQAALDQAQGNLRRDAALLAAARLDLTRYEKLFREDSIASQQLDTQRALVTQYEGTVQADQAQVKTAALNLQYTHIVSPVDGRVGLRQVDQGNYVTPADAGGIVVITELQPISAVFSIPEDYASDVLQRLRSGAKLPVEAYDRADSHKLATGTLLTADNQIDTTTGTIKLRALFDNRDGTLFPNQFVNIRLLEQQLTNQIIVPVAAIHRGAPKGVSTTFVYLLNSDRTVSVRPVVLGTADGERVAVTAGVAAGDVVVTEGGDRLRDGAPVILPQSSPLPAERPAERPAGHRGGGRRSHNRPAPNE